MRRSFAGIAMLLLAHVAAAAVFDVYTRVAARQEQVPVDWFDYGHRLPLLRDPSLVWLGRPLLALPIGVLVSSRDEWGWLLGFTLAAYLIPLVATLCALSFAWRRWSKVEKGCCANCGYDLRATPDRCPECGAVAERQPVTA